MIGFKRKNYLKRKDFIDSVDSKKIWSKSMTLSEIELLLENLQKELSKYEYDTDKNFIMNSRRKTLKCMIEERLQKNEGNINEVITESLFNFWEFVCDEYAGDLLSTSRESGISIKELSDMDNKYRKRGIICLQEGSIIFDMISKLKKQLNKSEFNKIEFIKAYYKSPEQWAESTIRAYSHHEPIKKEYLERLRNCKTWDDVLILSDEVVPFLIR